MADTINLGNTKINNDPTKTVGYTQPFSISSTYQKLSSVYDALKEKGYNPVNQILGYIITQDPTYITTHNDARKIMLTIDRDDLVRELLRSYLRKD